jgi:hypothetical protein
MLRLLKKSAFLSLPVLIAASSSAHAGSVVFNTLGSEFSPGTGNYDSEVTVYNSGGATATAPSLPAGYVFPTYNNGVNPNTPDPLISLGANSTVFLATYPPTTGTPGVGYNIGSGGEYLELSYTDLTSTLFPSGVNPGFLFDVGAFGFATNIPAADLADEDMLNGLQFTLDINQSIPAPGGTQTTTAVVSGTVTVTDGSTGANEDVDVSFNFNPVTVYVAGTPTISYTVKPDPVIVDDNNSSQPFVGTQDVSLFVALAPLPSTAGTGLSLLAGIGGFAALRRKFVKATVA